MMPRDRPAEVLKKKELKHKVGGYLNPPVRPKS